MQQTCDVTGRPTSVHGTGVAVTRHAALRIVIVTPSNEDNEMYIQLCLRVFN